MKDFEKDLIYGETVYVRVDAFNENGMYVYLHILSFKFETKIKIEGRTDGEENAETGKRRPEKGKMHPE